MASLNFLKRLLALNRDEPTYGPSMINVPSSLPPGTPPFLPAGSGGTVGDLDQESGSFQEPSGATGGPPPDFGGFSYPDPSRPANIGGPIASSRSVPTGLGRAVKRLQATLPGAIEAGIAGAATPNIAGGGPTDVLRSMAAASGTRRALEQTAYERQRQQQNDALNRQQMQARIELEAAQAAHARAQAQEKPKDDLMTVTAPGGGALGIWNVTKHEWELRSPAEPVKKKMSYADLEDQFIQEWRAESDPEKKAEVWNRLMDLRSGREKAAKETKQPGHWATDKQGNVSYNEVTPEGTPKTTKFGPLGVAKKETAAGGGEKPMTRKEAATLTVKKDAGLRKISLKYQKLHDDLNKDPLMPPADKQQRQEDLIRQEAEEAQGVQDDYETVVSGRTGQAQDPFDMAGFVAKRRKSLLADKQTTTAAQQPRRTAPPPNPFR